MAVKIFEEENRIPLYLGVTEEKIAAQRGTITRGFAGVKGIAAMLEVRGCPFYIPDPETGTLLERTPDTEAGFWSEVAGDLVKNVTKDFNELARLLSDEITQDIEMRTHGNHDLCLDYFLIRTQISIENETEETTETGIKAPELV